MNILLMRNLGQYKGHLNDYGVKGNHVKFGTIQGNLGYYQIL